MAIRILCYGDSNTWGAIGGERRHSTHAQWPHVLSKLLGDEFEIIQEGLCGRTAGDVEPEKPYRNGKFGFEIALRSATPIDLLVINLGSNDLKARLGRSAEDIYADLKWYRERARVETIYVLPANYTPNEALAPPEPLRDLIQASEPHTIALNDLEHEADQLHWTESDHKKVAERVAEKIKEIAR